MSDPALMPVVQAGFAAQPGDDRAASYVQDLKVEQRDGVAEAHYRFDLSPFAGAARYSITGWFTAL